jgi:hypothetical protein
MLRLALFRLMPFAIFAQDASLTLAGNIVDSQSGQSLAHALVTIQGFPKLKDSSSVTSPQTIRVVQGNMAGEVGVNVAGAYTENAVLLLYPAVDIPVTVRFTNPVAQAPARTAKRPRPADDDDVDVPSDECKVFLTPVQMNGNARAVDPVLREDGVLHNVVAGKRQRMDYGQHRQTSV